MSPEERAEYWSAQSDEQKKIQNKVDRVKSDLAAYEKIRSTLANASASKTISMARRESLFRY